MHLLFIFFCSFYIINAAPVEKILVYLRDVFDENSLLSPQYRYFEKNVVLSGWIPWKEITTHNGTHLDAPSLFEQGTFINDQIPVSKLISPVAVISIEDRVSKDHDTSVTVKDLENWERITGLSLNKKIVLFNSITGKKWPDRLEVLGTEKNDLTKLQYPGISREAIQWLFDNRKINGIGMDTFSFDVKGSTDPLTFDIFLGNGIFGFENVANLVKVPIRLATLYVMPMKMGEIPEGRLPELLQQINS